MSTILSGCSTFTQSSNQYITVDTYTENNNKITGAECELENDKGNWALNTPGSVMIKRSYEDLFIKCILNGYPNGYGQISSNVQSGVLGNAVFGGAVGAVVDHGFGTAYLYPSFLKIIMGQAYTQPEQLHKPQPVK